MAYSGAAEARLENSAGGLVSDTAVGAPRRVRDGGLDGGLCTGPRVTRDGSLSNSHLISIWCHNEGEISACSSYPDGGLSGSARGTNILRPSKVGVLIFQAILCADVLQSE